MNLIKQWENVEGRPCGSVAQLAECSHGKQEALGLSPCRATIFLFPCDISIKISSNSAFFMLRKALKAIFPTHKR